MIAILIRLRAYSKSKEVKGLKGVLRLFLTGDRSI